MITLSKWKDQDGIRPKEIPADAVTVDLRTQSNSLSFWKCADVTQIDDAILALASARDRLDKIEVVWVNAKELAAVAQLTPTKGKTCVVDLVSRHVDLCHLDYIRLGKVADRITAAVVKKQYRRLSKTEVKTLIVKAISDGRLSGKDLRHRLKEEVTV